MNVKVQQYRIVSNKDGFHFYNNDILQEEYYGINLKKRITRSYLKIIIKDIVTKKNKYNGTDYLTKTAYLSFFENRFNC